METLLGFDIGGTKSATVVGDTDGRVLARLESPTESPEVTVAALVAAAVRLCDEQRVVPRAAGVAVGSPFDRAQGLIQAPPNLPAWVDVPITARIQSQFQIPVNIENDADACALAEWRWGLQQEVDDLVYLTCGTGQGGGLILGGRLHRGCRNLAGEIGHVRLLPLGPVGCHKAGSVEGLTSGRALAELAQLRLAERPQTVTRLQSQALTGRAVGEAALAGDAFARRVVAELGEYLGRACAILIDVLNPQRISLGSLGVRLEGLLLEAVQRAAAAEALATSMAACTIAPAALGERVQDLSALAAALSGRR